MKKKKKENKEREREVIRIGQRGIFILTSLSLSLSQYFLPSFNIALRTQCPRNNLVSRCYPYDIPRHLFIRNKKGSSLLTILIKTDETPRSFSIFIDY